MQAVWPIEFWKEPGRHATGEEAPSIEEYAPAGLATHAVEPATAL